MLRSLLLLVGFVSFPLWASAEPPAPHSIIIISCRVDGGGADNTAVPGVHGTGDQGLTWHFTKGNELECRREEIPLTDSVPLKAPELEELHPNFSDLAQCSAVAMQYAPTYEHDHAGWGVMAVGCPVPIKVTQADGVHRESDPTISWHMPECPSAIGGMPITCKFDNSII